MTDGDVSNLDTPEDGNLVDEIDATEPTDLDPADRRLSDEAARLPPMAGAGQNPGR